MRFNSLAFRLFATSAAWSLLALPIVGIVIYRIYRDDVQATFDGRLEKLVNSIAVDSMGTGTQLPITPTNRYEPLFEETRSGWYWQIKPLVGGGARLASVSLGAATLESPIERKIAPDANGARWMNSAGPAGEPIRMVELVDSLDHAPDATRYSIIVAGPIDWFETSVANFLTLIVTALALTGAGLVAATLFQVRFGLLPLRKIELGLAAIRSGVAEKLEGELPAEIEPLQAELNALISWNQETVDRARTQVGNLAHALKTPLAVLTNEAREGKTPLGAKIVEQAEIMRDQISHYLDRARMAARVGVIGRVTPVAAVIESLVRALERIYQERAIAFTIQCPPQVRFQGERQDLEEMLGNLCDNASKWARKNVYVTVSLTPADGRSGRWMLINVEDNGPGISDQDMVRIGKRGIRLDETKPGSGLGLSIVSDLAQSYRGSLELSRSTHGGLCAALRLPAV